MTGRLTGVLVAMGTLLLITLSTGGRMYFLLFLILALAVLTGLISVLWTLFTLRVEHRGVKRRTQRGSAMMTAFTVRHAALLPASDVQLQVSAPAPGNNLEEVTVTSPPFVERTFRHVMPCPHRGVYHTGIVRITAMDAFQLFRISRRADAALLSVEVVPGTAGTKALPLGSVDVGPEYITRATEDTASPSDVRAWMEGDSLKKVHWKLSLRKREIMVRTYEEGARPDTLILPDLSEIVALRDQQLTVEDAICESALGAAKAQLEAGYPVSMPLTGASPTELSARHVSELSSFQDALMRVSFNAKQSYDQILMMMLGRLQRVGGAILVTARLTMRTADIALRMQRMGVAVKIIWINDDPRQTQSALTEQMRMAGIEVEARDPWRIQSAQTKT